MESFEDTFNESVTNFPNDETNPIQTNEEKNLFESRNINMLDMLESKYKTIQREQMLEKIMSTATDTSTRDTSSNTPSVVVNSSTTAFTNRVESALHATVTSESDTSVCRLLVPPLDDSDASRRSIHLPSELLMNAPLLDEVLRGAGSSWSSLSADEKQSLRHLLPACDEAHVDRVVQRLFSSENLFFGDGLKPFRDAMSDGRLEETLYSHHEAEQQRKKQRFLATVRQHQRQMEASQIEWRKQNHLSSNNSAATNALLNDSRSFNSIFDDFEDIEIDVAQAFQEVEHKNDPNYGTLRSNAMIELNQWRQELDKITNTSTKSTSSINAPATTTTTITAPSPSSTALNESKSSSSNSNNTTGTSTPSSSSSTTTPMKRNRRGKAVAAVARAAAAAAQPVIGRRKQRSSPSTTITVKVDAFRDALSPPPLAVPPPLTTDTSTPSNRVGKRATVRSQFLDDYYTADADLVDKKSSKNGASKPKLSSSAPSAPRSRLSRSSSSVGNPSLASSAGRVRLTSSSSSSTKRVARPVRIKHDLAPYSLDNLVFPTLVIVWREFQAAVDHQLSLNALALALQRHPELTREKPSEMSWQEYAELALTALEQPNCSASSSTSSFRSPLQARNKRRRTSLPATAPPPLDTTSHATSSDTPATIKRHSARDDDDLSSSSSSLPPTSASTTTTSFVARLGTSDTWHWTLAAPADDDERNALVYELQFQGQMLALATTRGSNKQARLRVLREGVGGGRARLTSDLQSGSQRANLERDQLEEAARYVAAPRTFLFSIDGRAVVSMPVKSLDANKPSARPRRQAALRDNRPMNVSMLTLVADALARLPGGVGTRPDILARMRDSLFLNPSSRDSDIIPILSGSLDRLSSLADPIARFCKLQKLWVHLHRRRVEPDSVSLDDLSSEQLEAARSLVAAMTDGAPNGNYMHTFVAASSSASLDLHASSDPGVLRSSPAVGSLDDAESLAAAKPEPLEASFYTEMYSHSASNNDHFTYDTDASSMANDSNFGNSLPPPPPPSSFLDNSSLGDFSAFDPLNLMGDSNHSLHMDV